MRSILFPLAAAAASAILLVLLLATLLVKATENVLQVHGTHQPDLFASVLTNDEVAALASLDERATPAFAERHFG